MRPHFNSHPYNANNQQQLQNNGVNASAPQQVIGNQGNFCPNPMQIRPQFQMGTLNNPQLAMPPFTNPNAYFPPPQFFPFPQASMQNLNNNNLAQLFAQNAVNMPQFLPNGQMNMPNLVQNVTQLLQMQMANAALQNSGRFMNGPPLGMTNGNGVVQQLLDGNSLKTINQNAAVTNDFSSTQGQHSQNVFSPGAANSQNNAGFVNGVNDGKNSWKKPHDKNFVGNNKHDASQRGFGKKQFQNRQNAQGNFKFNNDNRGKGKNFNFSNSHEQNQGVQKRSFALNYTEQEIKQWREERKRNYPSNANMEKKLKANQTKQEVSEEAAKIRRQQLKEILAKQAELGLEVAEIPSCYLSDSELQSKDGRQQDYKPFGKRERFNNKFDKKGKFNQNDRFSKRQRYENNNSTNGQNQNDRFNKNQRFANGHTSNVHRENKREPSLLKKLLSSDIKKDKNRLLQVFRFMVMNSFFENSTENPLKYPEVIVRESSDGSEIVEENPQVVKGDDVCNDDFDDISIGEDCNESPREVGEIVD